MKLKDIMAISGQPGLYAYVARSKNGVIVESLIDKKRINAAGTTSKVSSMTEISIYNENDDTPINKVFESLYKYTGGKEAISHKSEANLIKALFAEVVPDYDRERVHFSDMKKVIMWYNTLMVAGMTDFSIEEEGDEVIEEVAKDTEAVVEETKKETKKVAKKVKE